MRPHAWFMDAIELREYRHTIETVNSLLEKMGIERLHRGANAGFELKAPSSAAHCTHLYEHELAIKVSCVSDAGQAQEQGLWGDTSQIINPSALQPADREIVQDPVEALQAGNIDPLFIGVQSGAHRSKADCRNASAAVEPRV